jgi:competence protein ComEC
MASASIEILILDVGHGNCAFVSSEDDVIVIDAAQGIIPLEVLSSRGIATLRRVIVSHADQDHLSGVHAFLVNDAVTVRELHLNSDSERRTDAWRRFRVALRSARLRGEVAVGLTLTSGMKFVHGRVILEVVAPSPDLAISGCGGDDLAGRRLTANAMSAVVRVWVGSTRVALFAADIDAVGLDSLLQEQQDLEAKVLVFPHHGGLPRGANAYEFARRLVERVKPELVVFSLGRGKHNTPQPEIVSGVRSAAPAAHILCTQLSERCATSVPVLVPDHLIELPAQGRTERSCCGGSVRILVSDEDVVYLPERSAHREFVTKAASTAVCEEEMLGTSVS